MPARLLSLPLVALLAAVAALPSAAAQPQVAPQPRLVSPPPFDLADWTPRPARKGEPWELMTDKDWVDPRFREMDTGPFLNCTMRYPLGKDQPFVHKATAVKLGEKGEAGVAFDRCTMQIAAAWAGGFLNHSDRRFGLLNTPTPKGDVVLASQPGPGWAHPDDKWAREPDPKSRQFTAPLDPKWVKYRGLYLNGPSVTLAYSVGGTQVLESSSVALRGGFPFVTTTVEVGPRPGMLTRFVCDLPPDSQSFGSIFLPRAGSMQRIVVVHDPKKDLTYIKDHRLRVRVDEGNGPYRFTIAVAECPNDAVQDVLRTLLKAPFDNDRPDVNAGGPRRWGEPIVTKLVRGIEDGPFAVDTLTIPYKNPFNALFFCTGLDHLPDGRVAVCTCHGDVWLVAIDETAETCSWQRFATGLYHPLGLKVVDGKVVVLERGQLTRLHDLNADGEADFYECVNNDWDTGPGEHSYDTCLETDPQGNFYFFKTGDTHLPTGGCLMRVTRDGSKAEVFATGFRHPIGMGMSPTGVLTGADQEGNWMPATRIDEYKKGGFYGDMRAHHRADPPKTYDPPLCWLPREVDNSAGGQVWVPPNTFGPLAGLPLHFSYGRCRPFVLLRQVCDNGVSQGGVAALPVRFLSGVCRGRFGADGHLYVCGLNGWQTAAKADGCLQRVRYTGKPLDVPVKIVVAGDTLRLTFSRPLDPTAAAAVANYKAAWWNYRWAAEYGSKRWKASDPKAEGQDEFGPKSVRLLDDGKTVELTFERLQPVMQMQVGYNVAAADGAKVVGSVFHTIHTTGR